MPTPKTHTQLLTLEQPQPIAYRIRRHRRAKHLRLTVNCDASVVVTTPRFVPLKEVEDFVKRKANWILEKVNLFKNRTAHWCCRGPREEYLAHKHDAELLVRSKVREFNSILNFSYKKIFIKNQKSRWGSCSANGNLNFNYKLAFLDECLVDYVVVHELCHLKELNHSDRFWRLVASVIPDYQERRSELMMKRF